MDDEMTMMMIMMIMITLEVDAFPSNDDSV